MNEKAQPLIEMLEEFKELRISEENKMSEPIRKLLRKIHETIWTITN